MGRLYTTKPGYFSLLKGIWTGDGVFRPLDPAVAFLLSDTVIYTNWSLSNKASTIESFDLSYCISGTEGSDYRSCSFVHYQRPPWSTGHSLRELWKYFKYYKRNISDDNLLPATRAGNLSGENIPLLRGVGSVSGGQDYGVRRGCSEFHIHLKN